jgi:beta-lactamase regulating signal transducer with metallopeptidase domain
LFSAPLATTAPFGLTLPLLEGSTSDALTTASFALSIADAAASETPARSVVNVVMTHMPTAQTLALLGLLSMGVGLLRFGVAAYLLQRKLRGRVVVTDPRLLRRFARLRTRMGVGSVRLTESDTLASPLVIGRREVCVPRRLVSELADAEMDAVLAHELAHVERKDGLWFPLVAAVQSALWLQPLNHLVSSYVRHSAELACDDRAVELTGSPLGLARALVHVAERAVQARQMFVPMMVRHPSALLPRVRRLTETSARLRPKARAQGRWRTRLKLLAVGAGLATLSVRVSGARVKSPDSGARTIESGAVIPAASQPDIAAQSTRMAELATLEQALVAELASTEATPKARTAGTADQARVLELSQELRHVRGTQAWLEERFVAEWAAFEARSPTPR